MIEQRPAPEHSHLDSTLATGSPAWRRIGSLVLLGFGILLGLGGLWWLAFWLNASTAVDVQFTGMSMQEYQLAVRGMLIIGIFGLVAPAVLLGAFGMYLRRRP